MSYLCDMSKLLNYVFDVSLLDSLTKLGIYKITHLSKKDIFYIGSASGTFNGKKCQKGFYRRFLEHLHFLEHDKHTSKYLQNVVNKYGIEGIRFEILEIVETEDRKVILEREQYYLDTLKPAYNSSTTAKCPTVPYTEERKRKVSERFKGRPFVKEAYDKSIVSIFQFNKEGVFLKKYSSIKEASNTNNIDRASISNCAAGKRKSAGGYLWSYTNSILLKHKPKIYQHTLDGILVRTYKTLEELRKVLELTSSTSIRACISGKQKQAYGFKWTKY
jgi:group I intron endonuclease